MEIGGGLRTRVPRRPPGAPSRGLDAGKRNVLGVLVDAVDYDAVSGRLLAAARDRRPLAVTALAVHGVMTGVRDPAYAAVLNGLDVVTPDGQPVRWALNLLHRVGLADWVSGPELTLRVLRAMAAEGLPVFLYGSTPETLVALARSLPRLVPGLRIAGLEPSRFRPAAPGEETVLARRIVDSGARLVLVGLGCPRQELFLAGLRPLVDVPLLAVGAAFDYHAGRLRPAPRWAQRAGLAWVWRLVQEPGRLWRRYLPVNFVYLARLAAQCAGVWQPVVAAPARGRPPVLPV